MRFSATFALLGLLLCYLAVSRGGGWYLLLWAGISSFAVSAAYSGLGPKVFAKRSDGTIPFWSRLVHFPFFLYAAVVWQAMRLLSRENPFDTVDEDLVIGRRLNANESPMKFTNWVDLTAEFEDPKRIRETTNYICLPVLDATAPTPQALTAALSRLREGPTYVHCAQGHGRTALFALAFLAARGRIRSFEDGYGLLQRVRPRVRMNRTQLRFIKQFLKAERADSLCRSPHYKRSSASPEEKP